MPSDRTQEARERAEFTPSQKAAMKQIGLEIGAERAVERMIVAEARVSTLETALRPFAEKWDLHAAPYLNDTVDGEEARVLTARTVNEMIEDIKAARAALAEGDNH